MTATQRRNTREALDAAADAAVYQLIGLAPYTLNGSAPQIRQIVLAVMSRAVTIVVTGHDVAQSPRERQDAHIATFGDQR